MILILSGWAGMIGAGSAGPGPFVQAQTSQQSAAELITAEELKEKISRNEPLTIIDVRATSSYVDSNAKIKGAIYVKLRRLNSRLGFPPLKNVAHDSEIITYCACPNDESSLRAVQILSAAGFTHARALKGGWRKWLKVNGPVEPKPRAT
jgi:rhodanese-related sulfurtransferase